MTQNQIVDRAWDDALAGKPEAALRAAIAVVEGAPDQLSMVALLVRLLDEAGRAEAAEAACEPLVRALVRRGDLPAAVAVAARAKKAGKKLRKHVAATFGKGSERVADVPPSPPALPPDVTPSPELEKASRPALLDRAARALAAFGAWKDPVAEGKVPALPLFSSLAPAALERFLGVLTTRTLRAGEHCVHEGDEGKEAFVVVGGTLRAERRATRDGEPPTVLAVLGPGAIFGEMALVSDAPRAASVVAQEPVELLVAARSDLEALAGAEPIVGEELGRFCRGRMIANLVRTSSILSAAPAEERAALMGRFEARHFDPGDTLVVEGEDVRALYLVASGGVRVTKCDPDGETLVLADLGPGDVVGEIGVVLRRPATATVTAAHPTVALELTRAGFEEAIRAHPTLLGELYQLATQRDEETRSVVAQEVVDLDADVLL